MLQKKEGMSVACEWLGRLLNVGGEGVAIESDQGFVWTNDAKGISFTARKISPSCM